MENATFYNRTDRYRMNEGQLFRIRSGARLGLLAILFAVILGRVAIMIAELQIDNERPLLALPLTALFPAVLVVMLAVMPPAKSREGVLMRIGTMIQLLLIITFPTISLYLALGLPVVFLAVELFETRMPPGIRLPLTRFFVTC
jgi:hypothetical protein